MKTLILLAIVGYVAAQVQIQIPVQRPQAPQWQPAPPQRPVQPQPPQWQPRADWREGQFNPGCPNPDNVLGWASEGFLPGDASADFYICWGQIAFPFFCPEGSRYVHAERVCVDNAWVGNNNINRGPNNWNRRPFAAEEPAAEEN